MYSILEQLTPSSERYLRVLYNYWEIGIPRVSNHELALKLGLHPSTVTSNINKIQEIVLKGNPLIINKKYYGVYLTETGLRVSSRIERKFRIFEVILNQMGYDFYRIAQELEQNQLTYHLIDAIKSMCEKREPTIKFDYCPHGAPIPAENHASKLHERLIPLSMQEIHKTEHKFTFAKFDEFIFHTEINGEDAPKISNKLDKMNLQPGDTILISKNKSNIIEFKADGVKVQIPAELGNMIYTK